MKGKVCESGFGFNDMTFEKGLKELGSGDFGFSEFRRNLAQGGLGKAQVEFENHFVVIFLHLQSSF